MAIIDNIIAHFNQIFRPGALWVSQMELAFMCRVKPKGGGFFIWEQGPCKQGRAWALQSVKYRPGFFFLGGGGGGGGVSAEREKSVFLTRIHKKKKKIKFHKMF